MLSSSSDASTGVPLLLDAITASTTSVPFGTNNHWNGAGVTYTDGRGNLTGASASPNSFGATYDAENRQIQTSSIIGGSTTTVNYTYDGDGKRVSKAVAGGATTTYVYDAQGQLTAEYSTGTNPDSGTHYLTNDPLGSTRLVTNAAASPLSRSDYLPFGQEIPTTWGSRPDYAPDPSETIKFTRKERDPETELDFFEARYFSSAQGRFTSPDEFKGGIVDPFTGLDIETNTALPYADITDPQTLNKYGYVRNNPLRFVDPSGHCIEDLCIVEGAAAGYALYSATASAINWLQSPQGQESTKAFIQGTGLLINAAANSLSSVLIGPSTQTQQPTGTPGSPATTGVTPGTPGTPAQAPAGTQRPIQASGNQGPGFIADAGGNVVQIPAGSTARPASNGKGTVYQPPVAAGDHPDANAIRVMGPDVHQPTGSITVHGPTGQPINPATGKPDTRANTHTPIKPSATSP